MGLSMISNFHRVDLIRLATALIAVVLHAPHVAAIYYTRLSSGRRTHRSRTSVTSSHMYITTPLERR